MTNATLTVEAIAAKAGLTAAGPAICSGRPSRTGPRGTPRPPVLI
jgi:hypothetical protein